MEHAMTTSTSAPFDMTWLAAVLEPADIAPHPNFPDGDYDARPAVRLAALMMGDSWRVRRAQELATDNGDDPAALAARCFDVDTIASGVAELDRRLGSMPVGTDPVKSAALTLVLCAAATELDDFATCSRALGRQLDRLQRASNADHLLVRSALLQQQALRLCDSGDPYDAESREVQLLLRDLDPRALGSIEAAPWSHHSGHVTLRHIYGSLRDSADSLPRTRSEPDADGLILSRPRAQTRSERSSILRQRDQRDSKSYAAVVSELFHRRFGGRSSAFGPLPDTFHSVLALEVAGHGAVYTARKELALLRLVRDRSRADAIADNFRLLRQAGARKELLAAVKEVAASGPLSALSQDARQILRTRTAPRLLRSVELAVLQAAADLLTPTEARLGLDAVLASLAFGGPPDLPGSWQWDLLRREAAWMAAGALSAACESVDEVAASLLTEIGQTEAHDQLVDISLRKAATSLDWNAASADTRATWELRMLDLAHLLPATSEAVLVAIGGVPEEPEDEADPTTRIIYRLNAVIRGQTDAFELDADDVAAVVDALDGVRQEASKGIFAVRAVSEADVAAALVTEIGIHDLLQPLTDFLLDARVSRRHKTPAFERLARAQLNIPASVAARFQEAAPALLKDIGASFGERELVPYPAALRFLGAHRLRDEAEILGYVSELAASGDNIARREGAATVALLGSTAPSSVLLAMALTLSRDDDVDVRAKAGRALALMRSNDPSLEPIANSRLLGLLDEDGLQPPLVVLAALADLSDLPAEVTGKVGELARQHPSRSVRAAAARLSHGPERQVP